MGEVMISADGDEPDFGDRPFDVKGWCPGALRPMRSGDGLIVRLRPRGGALPAATARELGRLASIFGNDAIDLTQRANLQLRGVIEAGWPALIEALDPLKLLDPDAETESVRNIVVSPLAGFDPTARIDGRALAASLEQRIAADPLFRQLPSKFGFIIDEGGSLPLDRVAADVRLIGVTEGVAVEIAGNGGELVRLAIVDPAGAADAVATVVAAFLSLRGAGPTAARRLRHIISGQGRQSGIGVEAFVRTAGFDPARIEHRAYRQLQPVIGIVDGRHLGAKVVFGRLTGTVLCRLGDIADAFGVGDIRLTPWGSVLIPQVDPLLAARASDALADLGLIVDAGDPRLAVTACPGLPDCASGARAIRGDALALAPVAARLAGTGVRLHVSGCAKGCAYRQPAAVTIVAREAGYDLVYGGLADDAPVSTGLSRDAIEYILLSHAIAWENRKATRQ